MIRVHTVERSEAPREREPSWFPRANGRVAVKAAVVALGLLTSPAAQAEHVIPGGQEPLLLDMLGAKDALPGGCKLAGVSVDKTRAVARYECGAGQASLELSHRSASGSVKTDKFALSPQAGASSELTDAIASRIRARESTFRWDEPVPAAPVVKKAPSKWWRRLRGLTVFFAIVAIPIALRRWALGRKARAQAS
jgi:hypothetical protein